MAEPVLLDMLTVAPDDPNTLPPMMLMVAPSLLDSAMAEPFAPLLLMTALATLMVLPPVTMLFEAEMELLELLT